MATYSSRDDLAFAIEDAARGMQERFPNEGLNGITQDELDGIIDALMSLMEEGDLAAELEYRTVSRWQPRLVEPRSLYGLAERMQLPDSHSLVYKNSSIRGEMRIANELMGYPEDDMTEDDQSIPTAGTEDDMDMEVSASFWDNATEEIENERREAAIQADFTEAEPVREFLLMAKTHGEYENRKALVEDRLAKLDHRKTVERRLDADFRRTARLDDIVAYDYKADRYCPEHILEAMGHDYSTAHLGRTVEDVLDTLADIEGIDRYDEYTFDSGEFPKVVFRDQISGYDTCGFGHKITASRKQALAPFPTSEYKGYPLYAEPSNAGVPKRRYLLIEFQGDRWATWQSSDNRSKLKAGGPFEIVDSTDFEWTTTSFRDYEKKHGSKAGKQGRPFDKKAGLGDDLPEGKYWAVSFDGGQTYEYFSSEQEAQAANPPHYPIPITVGPDIQMTPEQEQFLDWMGASKKEALRLPTDEDQWNEVGGQYSDEWEYQDGRYTYSILLGTDEIDPNLDVYLWSVWENGHAVVDRQTADSFEAAVRAIENWLPVNRDQLEMAFAKKYSSSKKVAGPMRDALDAFFLLDLAYEEDDLDRFALNADSLDLALQKAQAEGVPVGQAFNILNRITTGGDIESGLTRLDEIIADLAYQTGEPLAANSKKQAVKVAWTPDGSDITPVAERLINLQHDAYDALGLDGIRSTEDRVAVVQWIVNNLGNISDVTDADLAIVEDYNAHSSFAAVEIAQGKDTIEDLRARYNRSAFSSKKVAKEWTPQEAWDLVGNQSTDMLKMMQKALNMMPMMNTPEENERLDAVNYILKNKVKNPRFSSSKKASQRYDIAKQVVDSRQAGELPGGILLDAFTASAMVQVYEALSPEAQSKFDEIPLDKLVAFVMSHVSVKKKAGILDDERKKTRPEGGCLGCWEVKDDIDATGLCGECRNEKLGTKKKAVNITADFLREWIFKNWLRRTPETEAEVDCMLSNKQNWEHIEAMGEVYRGQRWGDDSEIEEDDMGVDDALGFAITGLIEGGHDAPHKDNCPLKNSAYSKKSSGLSRMGSVVVVKATPDPNDDTLLAVVEGLFGNEARDAFYDYVGAGSVGAINTPHIETSDATYIEWTPDPSFDPSKLSKKAGQWERTSPSSRNWDDMQWSIDYPDGSMGTIWQNADDQWEWEFSPALGGMEYGVADSTEEAQAAVEKARSGS